MHHKKKSITKEGRLPSARYGHLAAVADADGSWSDSQCWSGRVTTFLLLLLSTIEMEER
jgi:hypothetical protein